MRTSALLLAAVVAAVFVVHSTAAPCGCTAPPAPKPCGCAPKPCGCVPKAPKPCGCVPKALPPPPPPPPCGCGPKPCGCVPKPPALPCGQPTYVKSVKSSSSTNSLAKEGSCSNVEIKANAATGEYSQKASNSADKSLARSGSSDYEAFEARGGAPAPVPVCIDVLPARKCGECDKTYYLRIFSVDVNCARSVQDFYVKVFRQYKGETDIAYVNRINIIFTTVYPSLDCRYNVKYIDLLNKYYTITYIRKTGETDKEYFTRVLTKSTETKEVYESKVTILKKYISTVDWSLVKIAYQSSTGFIFVSDTSSVTKSLDVSCTKTIVESEIVKKFAKLEKEDITSYFKRISTRSSELTVEQYIETVTIVRKNYPCLDLWYDVKYLDFVKDYYITLYTKQSCETEETFFRRIITRESFETEIQTVKRVEVVHNLFPNLPLWWDIKYYDTCTKTIFKSLYTKTQTETQEVYFSRIVKRISTEKDEVYTGRLGLIKATFPTLPCWYSIQYLPVITEFYTKKYTLKSCEKEEVLYSRIVIKETGETDELCAQRTEVIRYLYPNLPLWYEAKYYDTYTKKIYLTTFKKTTVEDETTYFSRICTQTTKETDYVYISRLSLIKKTFCTLPLWYSRDFLSYTRKYYSTKYTLTTFEKEELLYTSIVTKEVGETDELCAQRTELIHFLYPNLPLWYEAKYYDIYTKSFYQTIYKKTTVEDEKTYFSRICTQIEKETDTVYVKRLSIVKTTYSTLPLWYSRDFLSYTTRYYSIKYAISSFEKEELLYTSIVTKEIGETDELCALRAELIHCLYPNLPLWYEAKFYDVYTKNIYLTIYKKTTVEDEKTYYSRICTQITKETESVYISRLSLIEKTYYTLPLWYSVEYFTFTKKFYSLKYAKLSGECEEAYFKRLIAKEVVDISTEVYAQRIYLVHLVTSSCRVWYEEKYFESFTKSYYVTYYKKLDKEACDVWLTRVITVLPGECEEDAFKRITLVKKYIVGCNCWTIDVFNKLECAKIFPSAYLAKIKERFFVSSYEFKASSSSSSTKSVSGEETEDVVVYKAGGC